MGGAVPHFNSGAWGRGASFFPIDTPVWTDTENTAVLRMYSYLVRRTHVYEVYEVYVKLAVVIFGGVSLALTRHWHTLIRQA